MNPYLLQAMMQQQSGMPQDTTHPAMRGSQTPMQEPNTQAAQDMGYNPPPMNAPRSNPALANSVKGADEAKSPREQAREQGITPIDQGAFAALGVRKKMMQMDEEQKRQALGEAGMAFFSNLLQSKSPSMLGSINESFNPALQAWRTARKGHEDTNSAAIQSLDTLAHREREYGLDMQKLALMGRTEDRLAANPAGSLTSNQVWNMHNQLNKNEAAYNKEINETTDDLLSRLPKEQQTGAKRAQIKAGLQAQDHPLKRNPAEILNQAIIAPKGGNPATLLPSGQKGAAKDMHTNDLLEARKQLLEGKK